MVKRIFISFLLVLSQISLAAKCMGIHTWHTIKAKEGQWRITLQSINEQSYFTDDQCTLVTTNTLSSSNPFVYGFGFGRDADFDIAYTLTAVNEENAFQSKACVFVITAQAPAQPDIRAMSYNGASCEWIRVPGVGEDFLLG